MADSRIKDMKIKSGVVKRLAKEKVMYEKEVVDIQAKIAKMKSDGGDSYVIKKQEECVQESRAMVADSSRRLQNSINDLKQVLESGSDLNETDEYKVADEILKSAQV